MFIFSLQISKLETDIQRLNQSIDKQKTFEMQLRTDLKNVRKEIDDLRAENSALQTK
jgi:septal ring factor EnvC (AmiA/AmiB activator)